MPAIDLETASGRRRALERMLLIRAFENAVKDRFADGEIPGFVHLSLGQEAVAVGGCGALEADDYVTSTHRGHGHALACGLDPGRLMAEIYGKGSGYCRGKGGSMHVAAPEAGMLGAQAIVGAGIPVAVGAALTAQVRGEERVTVAFLGDGGIAAGQVHEGLNLAATWGLPLVVIIENNLYSEGMAFEEQHNIDDVVEIAPAYGIPSEIVDGQDVEEVYDSVHAAREHVITEYEPTLIEAKTYRYRGHFEGDPEGYRQEEEVREWRENRDPIAGFITRLKDAGEIDEDWVDAIRTDATDNIDDAVESARAAESPPASEAYEDIFADTVPEIDRFRSFLETDGGGR